MAMIMCPICKSSVSDSAQACSTCGFRVAEHIQKIKAENAPKKKRQLMIGGAVFLLFCGCCIFGQIGKFMEDKKEEAVKQEEQVRAQTELESRIAETLEQMTPLTQQLNQALDNGELEVARTLYGRIKEAAPGHEILAVADQRFMKIEADQQALKNRTDAAAAIEQARSATEGKEFIAADNAYEAVIQALALIDADRKIPEDAELEKTANSERTKIKRSVEQAQKDLEAKEERLKICGGSEDCIDVTAVKLCNEYKANEVRADRNYRDRTLLVTGNASNIGKDVFDSIIVTLRTPSKCMFDVIAKIPKDQEEYAAKLSKGDKLIVRCTGGSMILGSPTLSDCRLVRYWASRG